MIGTAYMLILFTYIILDLQVRKMNLSEVGPSLTAIK